MPFLGRKKTCLLNTGCLLNTERERKGGGGAGLEVASKTGFTVCPRMRTRSGTYKAPTVLAL